MLKKILVIALVAFTKLLVAQEAATEAATTSKLMSDEFILGLLLAVMLLAVGIIFALSRWLVILSNQIRKDILKEKGIEEAPEAEDFITKFFQRFSKEMTDAVPVEQEEEIVFEHEYDGIRELDNNLPPWWKYLFYGTIIFAIVYLFHYHVTGDGMSMIEEYEAEMAQAELQRKQFLKKSANLVDESSVTYLDDAASLSNGKNIFKANCVSCHGEQGQGAQVGPNLTDQYWIHGGSIQDIFKTIKYGVPTKGMIPWQTQLQPKQMQEVASYVMSLQGTDPPNAREPQGEKYVPEETKTESNTEAETDTETETEPAPEETQQEASI